MKPAAVYLITNRVNGKLYVGKTCRPEKRWAWHVKEAKKASPAMAIAWAIRKYGADAFLFEVLETFSSEDEAFWWESWWIQYLGSHHTGYNLDAGGSGGRTLSAQTRKKMSDARLGWRPSTETRARMSAAQVGKKRSSEAIEKTASALRGRARPVEVVEKIAALKRGVSFSEEARQRIAEAAKNRPRPSVESNQKRSAALRGVPRPPEVREKIAASRRAKAESS